MRYLISYLASALLILLVSFCGQTAPHPLPASTASDLLIPDTIPAFTYDSVSTPEFFEQISAHHWKEFSRTCGRQFNAWCEQYDADKGDTLNARKYYTICLLHELFTSSGASDCAKGEILSIPYMWHWVSPNPRHEITYLPEQKLLKEKKPPKEYGKYATYADIDRTPYLFISEMLSETPMYSHPQCGTFHSFGWCSEREMAFTCVAEMLGFPSHVIASNNHSWSEIRTMMNTRHGQQSFVVRVDNTFDQLDWTNDQQRVKSWTSFTGDSPMAKWYNDKAHAEAEINRLKAFVVPVAAAQRVEGQVRKYLQR